VVDWQVAHLGRICGEPGPHPKIDGPDYLLSFIPFLVPACQVSGERTWMIFVDAGGRLILSNVLGCTGAPDVFRFVARQTVSTTAC
jgi:hypothetical protein